MIQPISTKYGAVGFVESRIGGRQQNQDSAGVKDTPLGLLVVVCDGMGGMQGGQVASVTAVTAIMSFFDSVDKQSDPAMTLVKAIHEANSQILAKAQETPELKGMGTTVTALLKTAKSAIVAHVGDSRIYQFRGSKKVFRTFDHSMVFEMVKKKVLSEEQARLSVQSNVILRALGVKTELEVEWHELPYLKGDRFVLCSDGFWGAMPEKNFISLITRKGDIKELLQNTANQIEVIEKEKCDDYDNLTAAIVDVNNNSKMQEKMNKLAKTIIGLLAVLLIVSIGLNGYQYSQGNKTFAQAVDSINNSEERQRQLDGQEKDSTDVEPPLSDEKTEKKEKPDRTKESRKSGGKSAQTENNRSRNPQKKVRK